MVEACASPRSPSSSSVSTEAVATLAALVAAAEQLTSDSEEERLWSSPTVHQVPQFNVCDRAGDNSLFDRPDTQQQHVQNARPSSALSTELRRAGMPKPCADGNEEKDVESDSQMQNLSGRQQCRQSVSAASRAALYRCDPVGRRMRNSKLRHVWLVRLAGEPQDIKVELLHSRFTGKKQVLIDGKVMCSTRKKCLDWHWEHPVTRARVCLHSENGNHQLLCEEPKYEPPQLGESHVSNNEDLACRSRPSSPRSPCICHSPIQGSPRSPAPLSSPQLLNIQRVPFISDDDPSAEVCDRADIDPTAARSTAANRGMAESKRQAWFCTASADEHMPLEAVETRTPSAASQAESVQLAANPFGSVQGMAETVVENSHLETSVCKNKRTTEPMQMAAPWDQGGQPAPSVQAAQAALLPEAAWAVSNVGPSKGEDAQPAAGVDTGHRDATSSPMKMMTGSFVARDEENRRLQELIEQRDVQIASLQGQLRHHEPRSSASVYAIPPAPTSLPDALPSAPAAIPTPVGNPRASAPSAKELATSPQHSPLDDEELDVTRAPSAKELAISPQHSPLDDEELDVTRRLGPVHPLPDATPARVRAASVQLGFGPTVGMIRQADQSRRVPVKVEVKVGQASAATPRVRAASTPPAVYYIQPQSVRHEIGGQCEQPSLPSAVSKPSAPTPAHYRQVMTPRRLVPVSVQQQASGGVGGVGQFRSATPVSSRDGYVASNHNNRPAAPRAAPATVSTGRPSRLSNLRLPSEPETAPAEQGTPRVAVSQGTPQATSTVPPHSRPQLPGHTFRSGSMALPPGVSAGQETPRVASSRGTPRATSIGTPHNRQQVAGHSFRSASLAPPPGKLLMPSGMAGFAAAGLAAAIPGNNVECAESTPRCRRLPPAPFLAAPGGQNGIRPGAVSVHNYVAMPAPYGGS